ncbi:MAG: thermonuclease family protein [bacterium]|nr:thermonuclease family protein [Candidatus Jorgensenbacteria bacterium]
MKIKYKIIVVIALSFFVGVFFQTPKMGVFISINKEESESTTSSVKSSGVRIRAHVTRVIDGDTLKVFINDRNDTVRLIGIDSPEIVDTRKPVQCFANEASAKMTELVSDASVFLEEDATQGDRDKYGRLLRFVFLENGNDIGELMLEGGYAFEYTHNKAYKYTSEYKSSESDARNTKVGLWNQLNCLTKIVGGRLETIYK